jgi:hypothetical protein
MIKEPYKPVTDPQERLIQVRGVRKLQGKPLEMRVPYSIQEFFAKMLNHLGHRSDWFATCITCKHWCAIGCGGAIGICDGKCEFECSCLKQKHCTKFNCMPPPEVIADGCEYYEDNDEVPF